MGITFQEDCLIGAEDALEAWACQSKLPVLTGLAYKGILSETIIVVIICILIVLVTVLYLKRKENKPHTLGS